MSPHIDDTRDPGETRAAELAFDRAAQLRHAQALTALSPQIRSRLRANRRATTTMAPTRHRLGWILASGSAAVLAVAVAMQLEQAPAGGSAIQTAATTPETAVADADYRNLVAGLEENPDLYLWLAANHDTLPLPSER